ncbi:MAG TPA: hypothetical protein VNS46_21300 [Nocardioides sp.]|nr:hypothetical protein [Nocardioides sp.]
MFNRNRNRVEDPATDAAFDDVLAELGAAPAVDAGDGPRPDAPPAAPAAPPAEDDAPDEGGGVPGPGGLEEHADALRATRDAQQQAQEMLVLAAATRAQATDQAEQIVLEAKAAAYRVRSEAAAEAESARVEAIAWVNEQRSRVERVAAQLARNAERDAERIRAEAMRSAMAEAEAEARLHVGEAAARGARDAEEIRGSAREILHRAVGLGEDLKASMADLVRAVSAASGAVTDQLQAIDALLAEVRPDPRADGAATSDPDDHSDDHSDDPDDEVDDARTPDDPDDPDGTDVDGVPDDLDAPAGGRRLGSLFRDLEQ